MTDPTVRVVLLDVEGTTAPIDFVYSVLFPFARRHVEEFLVERWVDSDVRASVDGLVVAREGEGPDAPAVTGTDGEPSVAAIASFVRWLMDRDRKTTALKSLQGLIWEAGYVAGELRSTVFADVPAAFERWSSQGLKIGSYSSGSVKAQRLLYEFTTYGDMAKYVSAWFDTTTGAKGAPESYTAIVRALRAVPENVVFVSDVTTELVAAREAGLRTLLSVRPGNRPQPRADEFESVATFAGLFPQSF